MTLGSTHAIALAGLEGRLVEVEAHLSNALPGLIVSGLPDAACRQAPERIRAAAESSGLPLPSRKIVVNLSPAARLRRCRAGAALSASSRGRLARHTPRQSP